MGLPSKRAAWLHSRQPHRSTFVIPRQARNPWCPGRESSPVSDTLARIVGRLERQDAERAGPLARPSQKAAEAPAAGMVASRRTHLKEGRPRDATRFPRPFPRKDRPSGVGRWRYATRALLRPSASREARLRVLRPAVPRNRHLWTLDSMTEIPRSARHDRWPGTLTFVRPHTSLRLG